MARNARVRGPGIAFRLEWGGALGWGHLARCAALAGEIQRRGCCSILWTDGNIASAPDDMRAAFDVVAPAGASWITQVPVAVHEAAWVVVDLYSATDDELRVLRNSLDHAAADQPAPRLLLLDDDGTRRLAAASMVLNSRLGLRESPYAPGVDTLLGEWFALLRPGLRTPTPVVSPFPSGIDPVLVILGGTDPGGLTATVVHAIADVDERRFAPVVIRARTGAGADAVQSALSRCSASAWHHSIDASTLAGWAGVCRFAISAAGGTLYELALLGVPFVAISVAANQRLFAEAVAERWGMPVVASGANLRTRVAGALRALQPAHPAPRPGPRGFFGAIDGEGAARVAARLISGMG